MIGFKPNINTDGHERLGGMNDNEWRETKTDRQIVETDIRASPNDAIKFGRGQMALRGIGLMTALDDRPWGGGERARRGGEGTRNVAS